MPASARNQRVRWNAGTILGGLNPTTEQIDDSSSGIFRVWQTEGGNISWREEPKLTPSAQQAKESWNWQSDDPLMKCIAPGMPGAMTHNFWAIEFVDLGDKIQIEMEEFGSQRTIHMNTEPATVEVLPSSMGFSLGRWQGNTLIVITNNVNYPYFHRDGTPLSTSAEILERFILSDDGTRLDYEMVVTDPEVFQSPLVGDRTWVAAPGMELLPYDCAISGYSEE
jgi:hypothetical protein